MSARAREIASQAPSPRQHHANEQRPALMFAAKAIERLAKASCSWTMSAMSADIVFALDEADAIECVELGRVDGRARHRDEQRALLPISLGLGLRPWVSPG